MSTSQHESEAPLGVEELFFSRTDRRGIIRAGNTVFQRISQFSWDEMIGAPHKLVRHPDMPKAVFFLLWDAIKAGRPIGAYVKNRTKDGRHYWVFANVSVVEDGYLSVRLKPTSDLLSKVVAEYATVRRRENEEQLSPAESAAFLLERLAKLGFADYPAFMASALSREVRARDAALGRRSDPRIARFESMLAGLSQLKAEGAAITGAFEAIRPIPYNMRIIAARLGDAAGPIGVIASNHNTLSREVWAGVERLLASLDGVYAKVVEGMFVTCTARLQRDVVRVFEAEAGAGGPVDHAAEMKRLSSGRGYGAKARHELDAIAAETRRFTDACASMSRIVTGLNVTRVMCKVESARLPVQNGGLAEVIARLDSFQTVISAYLAKTDGILAGIQTDTEAQLKEVSSLELA